MENNVISKLLSRNDTGETDAHMAGILIPKKEEVIGFFPLLNKEIKNPRVHLTFYDEYSNGWKFSYIYYNNRFFGGTRNEYRLTGMTKYIREKNLKAGDVILFFKENGEYKIEAQKEEVAVNEKTILKLGNSYKVINI
jgi:hypothetical protein